MRRSCCNLLRKVVAKMFVVKEDGELFWREESNKALLGALGNKPG